MIAPGIFDGFGGTVDGEGYGFGDAVEGEVAGDLELPIGAAGDGFGDEGHGRILGDFEKILFQIFVAGFVASVDGGGVDGGVDHRFGGVGLVELHGAGHVGEFTLDFRNAKVRDFELGVGVGRIDLPVGSLREGRQQRGLNEKNEGGSEGQGKNARFEPEGHAYLRFECVRSGPHLQPKSAAKEFKVARQ